MPLMHRVGGSAYRTQGVRAPLPLRKRDLWSLACAVIEPTFLDRQDWDDPVYFAVEDGELIVSTEPLGDDPVVNPQIEGAYTP